MKLREKTWAELPNEMNFKNNSVKSCCGSSSNVYKLEKILHKDFLKLFVMHGFTERKHFTDVNILYIESPQLIVTGAFGSDNLQLKCKIKECQKYIEEFDNILLNLG